MVMKEADFNLYFQDRTIQACLGLAAWYFLAILGYANVVPDYIQWIPYIMGLLSAISMVLLVVRRDIWVFDEES